MMLPVEILLTKDFQIERWKTDFESGSQKIGTEL
jgi:hypothetical protein